MVVGIIIKKMASKDVDINSFIRDNRFRVGF